MKKFIKMKTLTILSFLTLIVVLSCTKNGDKPNNNNNSAVSNCVLKTYEDSANSYKLQINYDANYQVLSIEENGGSYTSIVPYKDGSNRIYKINYFKGSDSAYKIIYQFDGNGRIVLESIYGAGAYPYSSLILGVYIVRTYNNSGTRPNQDKLYSIDQSGNTSLYQTTNYTFDNQGNVLIADQGTSIDTYTYDNKPNALRNTSFLPSIQGGNANNIATHYTKDASGNITSSVISTYTYDSKGNVIQETDVDNFGKSTVYNYTFQCH